MEQSKYVQDLIIANATGNISEDEKQILFRWKSESKSNLEEYNRLTRLCKRFGFATEWDNINVEKAKVLFKNKTEKKRLVPLWIRIAASIIIIFYIGFTFFYENTFLSETHQVVDILPGKSKATLTLSDGQIIDLENSDSKVFDKIEGVQLIKNDSRTLVYNKLLDYSKVNIKYNTIKVPRGGEYQLVLSDGTKVWLNSETTLKYPINFVGNTREVTLIGEAYFEVAHNKEKPFYVSLEVSRVKVLGTSFNIKAFRGEENTEVTLTEGKVNVEVDNNKYLLIPGNQAKINRSNRDAEVINVDVNSHISWKDGVFQFVDISIEELVISLGRWYDVEFVFSRESLKYERFSGAVTKYRNIKYILDIIEETKDLRFEIDKKKITVVQR